MYGRDWKEFMSQPMLDVLISEADMIAEYKMCKEKYHAAIEVAGNCFPGTAVSGGAVLHGARKCIYSVAEYWNERMHSAMQMLPIEVRDRLENEEAGHTDS